MTTTEEAVAPPAEVMTPVEEGTETGRQRMWRLARRLRPGPVQLLFLLVFLGLAVCVYLPAWSSPTTRTMRGGDGDPAIFMWFLRWVPFALAHGHDLLVTHHLNYPDGVNLMWNTSLPLPGLLLTPVTDAWGPVLSFNLVLVLGYGLSAWCAYLAIRRFVPGHLAAGVGGLVYGFSPAILGQASHRLMTLAYLVPLLLLAMTALLALAMLLLVVLTNLRRVRGRVAHALKGFLTAAVVFAAIAAWPLSVQLTGPQRVDGDIHERNRSTDLQGFVVPSSHQMIAPAAAAEQARKFVGNPAYLGLPLLLVLGAIGVRWRSNPVVRVALALVVVSALLSLGPSLLVGGRDTGVWLPWAFFERLPLLPSLIPSRLAQMTALFAGLLLALFLQAVWKEGGWRRLAAPAVGLLVLMPLWPSGAIPARQVDTPAFFTGPAVRELPQGGVALVLPFPNSAVSQPMTWQAEANLWFRMPGGYFIGPGPDGRARFNTNPSQGSTTLYRIYQGKPPPRLTAELRQQLAGDFVRWRVGSVVVGPMPNQAAMVGFLTELLGRQPRAIDGVYLWRDPVVGRP